MKRFYQEVTIRRVESGWAGTGWAGRGWQVHLDHRPLRSQGGLAQIVPTRAAADLLAEEWRAQGRKMGDALDPCAFVLRDLADHAIDIVGPDRAGQIARLLAFASSDTLCYRAGPDDPIHQRQLELWEPLVSGFERRHQISLRRIIGIIPQPQEAQALSRIEARLQGEDAFTLATLGALATLSASLIVPLALRDGDGEAEALFAAANCEEDWQAERWGKDPEAEARRAQRLASFRQAARFLEALAAR